VILIQFNPVIKDMFFNNMALYTWCILVLFILIDLKTAI